ncbi:MAG: aldehyde dehydrogenase, partial [Pseudomonadales bacterium 32-61-5]
MTSSLSPYTAFDGQFIDGVWRKGRSGKVRADDNPYNGEVVAEIALADMQDLEDAYAAAQRAQKIWGKALYSERSELFHRALKIIDARKDEIIDWIVRETGSTLLKANIEWRSVRGSVLEAINLPSRVQGRIMPIDVPGKQSFVFREPLGVIGVISPWNFPFHLSHRSVAPALAMGNAVVLKPAEDTPITGGLLIAKIYEEAGL